METKTEFKIGDKIEISGDLEFPQGTTGTIQEPPLNIVHLVPDGEWCGLVRTFVTPTGIHKSYWVHFDIPTEDSSGDGPYRDAEISLENLKLI